MPETAQISEQFAQTEWFANTTESKDTQIVMGDLVLLLTLDEKRFLIRLRPGKYLHTHRGRFNHDDLVGKSWGETVKSQIGHIALVLEPSIGDLMRNLKRGTQIIYAKDAAYLIHRLSLRAGSRVIEAGTGSGALTLALAWSVAPTGRVYTYEVREVPHDIARRNLERFGLAPYVEMFHQSIADGFLQSDVDALFLDVREPWHFLSDVHKALRPGGFFACLLPTTNQVNELLRNLEGSGFAEISIEELLLRRYKPVPDRLRPDDEMVGHTGYLVFARTLAASVDPSHWLSRDRKRYLARQKAQEQLQEQEQSRLEEQAKSGRKYPRMPLP